MYNTVLYLFVLSLRAIHSYNVNPIEKQLCYFAKGSGPGGDNTREKLSVLCIILYLLSAVAVAKGEAGRSMLPVAEAMEAM